MTIPVALAILLIGLTLGLIGAGGSILTVPLLLYVGHLPLKEAIIISFFVVASSSLVALIFHVRNRTIDWQLALIFGLPAMLGAFIGGSMAAYLPNNLILTVFYLLMLLSGLKLAFSKTTDSEPSESDRSFVKSILLLFSGLIIGLLTGTIGVGGGFLIVPALLLLAKITPTLAIVTSLCIVAGQASFGLVGYAQHTPFDLQYASVLTVFCCIGSLSGAWLSTKIENAHFKLIFGWFLIIFSILFSVIELTKIFGLY
jgi:hypothetical protein